MQEERWVGRYLGEAIGDFILIFFGCGIIFEAILFGGVGDLFSAGMAWGLAVALAVYVTASMSGTHINPAVTIALAATGRCPRRRGSPDDDVFELVPSVRRREPPHDRRGGEREARDDAHPDLATPLD